MSKRLLVLFMSVLFVCALPMTAFATGNSPDEQAEKYVLPASEAEAMGSGIDPLTAQNADTQYSEAIGAIVNFGASSEIQYTVPTDVCGCFDIYVNVGKSTYSYGSTPLGVMVNEEKEYVRPVRFEPCAADYSDLYSQGSFLMAENVVLSGGDTLTVKGKNGFEISYGDTYVSFMPSAIGDLTLYPAGTIVATGFDQRETVKEEKVPSDPLSGRRIVWLGSSVTYGMQSGGYTMAEELEANHAATECIKYAISGTTLVNETDTSYVTRLKAIDPDMAIDLLIVQLSTNDASQGKTLGALSSGTEYEDFDDTTIVGAMEYIIRYARDTWNCPVVFYTGSFFEDDTNSESYGKMVDALLAVQEKWDIGVVDLWNNAEMSAIYGTDGYNTYMSDTVHPTREGYVAWWYPKFEEYLTTYLAG